MLTLALAIGSGLSLLLAVAAMLWPDRELAMVAAEEDHDPPPLLTKFRGWEAVRRNVFPRSWDTPCSCNARVLVWAKDGRRHDAWVASCRRCGLPRLDMRAGETVEL